MKSATLIILFIWFRLPIAIAQQSEVIQPDQTLTLQSDTLYWEIPELRIASHYLFSKMDAVTTMNNDVQQGQSFTFLLKNGKQALRCPSPQARKTIFPVKVKKGNQTKVINVIFWIGPSVHFDPAYRQANQGKATTQIPEVFELINIVFALTQKGGLDSNMIEMNSPYYREVMQHFKPFQQHPLLKQINEQLEKDDITYWNYRLDSYGYSLQGNKLVPSPHYQNLGYRQSLSDYASLWERFIIETKFSDFYQDHLSYYQQLIQQADALLQTKRMWQWLEERFPDRYESYKIVISPLINGRHNTVRYKDNNFTECLMFVRDARRYDPKQYSASVISGLYSGIVFTEIDHNYVNPVSDTFKSRIDSVFKNREKWTSGKGDAQNYRSAYSVFNEYMTHSVYLIYIQEFYTPDEYEIVKNNRIALMNRRGFRQFASFHEALLKLYQQQEKKNFVPLYPSILDWSLNFK